MARQIDHLIHQVRMLTGATALAYTLGTANYWDDTQITLLLDRYRFDFFDVEMAPAFQFVGGGSVRYTRYYSPYDMLEQTLGGTEYFIVKDGLGSTIGTANYTPDYDKGIVVFSADQRGSVHYLTGRSFDIRGAAVDLLESWEATLKLEFDFTTEDQEFVRSQKLKNIRALVTRLKSEMPITTAQLYRSDVPGWYEE